VGIGRPAVIPASTPPVTRFEAPQVGPDRTPVTAEFAIDAYHRLFQIEKSFRMPKHDLQARPIYHTSATRSTRI
jgi:hypothetical protein